VRETYHDRVLAMAERLVREHPEGRDILALVLRGAGAGDDLEVRHDPDAAPAPEEPS
jgi:hypothetical protein